MSVASHNKGLLITYYSGLLWVGGAPAYCSCLRLTQQEHLQSCWCLFLKGGWILDSLISIIQCTSPEVIHNMFTHNLPPWTSDKALPTREWGSASMLLAQSRDNQKYFLDGTVYRDIDTWQSLYHVQKK